MRPTDSVVLAVLLVAVAVLVIRAVLRVVAFVRRVRAGAKGLLDAVQQISAAASAIAQAQQEIALLSRPVEYRPVSGLVVDRVEVHPPDPTAGSIGVAVLGVRNLAGPLVWLDRITGDPGGAGPGRTLGRIPVGQGEQTMVSLPLPPDSAPVDPDRLTLWFTDVLDRTWALARADGQARLIPPAEPEADGEESTASATAADETATAADETATAADESAAAVADEGTDEEPAGARAPDRQQVVDLTAKDQEPAAENTNADKEPAEGSV